MLAPVDVLRQSGSSYSADRAVNRAGSGRSGDGWVVGLQTQKMLEGTTEPVDVFFRHMSRSIWNRAVALTVASVVLMGCGASPRTVSPPSPASAPRTVSVPAQRTAKDVRIAAVGDMNPARNVSKRSASGKNGAAIAAGLANRSLDAFIGLGDFQYSTAYCRDYVKYWRKLWGGTKSKLYWVSAPNHDWQPGRNTDLDNFMNGQCRGDSSKSAINRQRGFISNGTPYSRNFGNWHIAFLSTALWRYDTPRARRVTKWLDHDLSTARAAGKHLGVVYHDAYFTSNTSSHSRAKQVKPWINVMYQHRVRFTLSGSQHNYERTCPVNNAGRCVADGMTAFQVSTGGVKLRSFTSRPSFIARRFSDTHGFIKLTLKANGSFQWKFQPVAGRGTDSGTRRR